MKARIAHLIQIFYLVIIIYPLCVIAGDDDDDDQAPGQLSSAPTLSQEQLNAVGIAVAHPVVAKAPERIAAVALVLDTTTLISDFGEMTAASVAEHSASAELTRLRGLYSGGAGASLKMLEAAQAEQAKMHAQAESANARFALHWGPVAALPASKRQKLIESSTSGNSLLLRADLPGRHSLGALPDSAMLDVDGIQVPGRVLGSLLQTTEMQSTGLLIEVESAPSGLGPGARVPVALLSSQQSGLLLPRDALLYDEKGAYVYKQLSQKVDKDKTRYVPVQVKLLLAVGDGWLVEGIDDDDNIVVHGAGVLWSLQAMGSRALDDDD